MRFTGFTLVCFSTIILVSVLGCSSFGGGGGQVSGINWALAKNGGRVIAFSEEPEYPASALNDGIKSPAKWSAGEGWQASISVPARRVRGMQARKNEEERNSVVIEFAQPVTVNQVKLYNVNSEEFPSKDFGVSDLSIQHEMETALKEMLWVDVERFGVGIGQDEGIKGNVNAVIDYRFKPVTTRKVRVLIHGTNDLVLDEGGRNIFFGITL